MSKRIWYKDLIVKVTEIEEYRLSKKDKSNDDVVAFNMFIKMTKTHYEKIKNNETEKFKAKKHIDKLYKLMLDNKKNDIVKKDN